MFLMSCVTIVLFALLNAFALGFVHVIPSVFCISLVFSVYLPTRPIKQGSV